MKRIMHIVAAIIFFTVTAFICVGIGTPHDSWFTASGLVDPPFNPPIIPIDLSGCEIGYFDFSCDDTHKVPLDEMPSILADWGKISDGGMVALAFSCISLPFAFFAAVLATVRGFKLSPMKVLSTVALSCSWLTFLFLFWPWIVFLGTVSNNDTFNSFTPGVSWALSITAWGLSLLGAFSLTFAAISKGGDSGAFGGSGGMSFSSR